MQLPLPARVPLRCRTKLTGSTLLVTLQYHLLIHYPLKDVLGRDLVTSTEDRRRQQLLAPS